MQTISIYWYCISACILSFYIWCIHEWRAAKIKLNEITHIRIPHVILKWRPFGVATLSWVQHIITMFHNSNESATDTHTHGIHGLFASSIPIIFDAGEFHGIHRPHAIPFVHLTENTSHDCEIDCMWVYWVAYFWGVCMPVYFHIKDPASLVEMCMCWKDGGIDSGLGLTV